ncbi:MAG: hypothetical protein LUC34_03890 [Campylobacter sp.]|nr:hypothetical protein [Campylobacter sp.]
MIYIEQYKKQNFINTKNIKNNQIVKTHDGLSVRDEKGCERFKINANICAYDLIGKNIWCANRLNSQLIQIMVFSDSGRLIASLDMQDFIYESDILFTGLPDENRIIVSFAGGQDGSCDYCISLRGANLNEDKRFPLNQTYMFNIGNHSLSADFYSSKLLLVSYPNFDLQIEKTYDIFQDDSLANVWSIDAKSGIFCTTEGRWYLFDLRNLDLIDELSIKGYEPNTDSFGILCSDVYTLFQTKDELIFSVAKGGGHKDEYISVDKIYLISLINKAVESFQKR